MADWIHCNECFVQPDVNRRFELTNCGHIFCVNCVRNGGKTCPICQKSCSTIVLSSQMQPEVEVFFMNPKDVAKRHLKELHKVIEFQQGHRTKFYNYQMSMMTKAKSLAEEYKKLMLKLEDSKKQTEKLRQEQQILKQKLYNSASVHTENLGMTPQQDISPSERGPQLSRLSIRTPISRGNMMNFAPNTSRSNPTPSMSNSGLFTSRLNAKSSYSMVPKQRTPFIAPENPRHPATSMQISRAPGYNHNVLRNQNLNRLARVSPYSPHDF